ncbi:MAG: hypothetical protein LAN84_01255 [Acidobacteriia bacterium]|nr:hypothetical protein [Terriglobia bacterium]
MNLTADDIAWVKAHAAEVTQTFGAEFAAARDRFKEGQLLLNRFNTAIESVLKNGRGHFSPVDEAHNEICIASALLANTRLRFIRLEYEPPLPGCAKTIDFRATADNGQIVYVDVKTIKSQAADRWDQFEKATKEGWIADNVHVVISQDWLGGEIWHAWFAARARMLEYTLELEQKIAEGNLAGENTPFVLALCGDGFGWQQDGLEDFVSFYYSGIHRADDAFSKVELRYISDKKITINRTISQFAYMKRPQSQIRPIRLNWNVRPPRDSFFKRHPSFPPLRCSGRKAVEERP